jgi:hypothetical protein
MIFEVQTPALATTMSASEARDGVLNELLVLACRRRRPKSLDTSAVLAASVH